MRYRRLGKTGVEVGIVGLGAEYLEHSSKETVVSVVDEAISNGVNYIDLFMASPGVRDNFGIALKNRRYQVMIAGHLGSAFGDGQYYRTRDLDISESFFHDLLNRLQTDYIDVLMLHYVDEPDEYDVIFKSGEFLKLAQRLKGEGKARFIGMSSHRMPSSLKAVKSGYIDVLMYPVNPVFDTLSGSLSLEETLDEKWSDQSQKPQTKLKIERRELYQACAAYDVGIIAMKPYAAGRLFNPSNASGIVLTPVQCLHYALSQPGVCTVVPGCKDVGEMKAAIAYLDASDEERDYSLINASSFWKLQGSCMYCNHCLPCPVGIDIGTITRLADIANYKTSSIITSQYESLATLASECTQCGVCMERCPFDVDVTSNMINAAEVFGR
jgi:predicted aldo/keto reductase-like oxidoreductase